MNGIRIWEELAFCDIDFADPIFAAVRNDYEDFDEWRVRALGTRSVRLALVVRSSDSTYAGIAILKLNKDSSDSLSNALKMSTLRVMPEFESQGVADVLMSGVFAKAIEFEANAVYVTVYRDHQDLTRYLELRGFRRAPRETMKGESVYVADFAHPEGIFSDLSRLAYDLLAEEYEERSRHPGPSQESPEFLAGLLASHLNRRGRRLLELGPGAGDVLAELGRISRDTVAIEISPRMAAVARQHAPDALIVIADALDVDFSENAFDGIYAGAFLHLFPEREAAQLVRSMARWTKPDGAIFVNTSVSPEHSESLELKHDYLHRVARFRSRWTEAQFRELIESNGLSVAERITTDESERGKSWVAFVCRPN